MTRFRGRIGEAGCERILKASLDIQQQRVDVGSDVVIDSTVQEKNIIYLTFSKLDVKVIEKCRAIAAAEGIALRLSYVRVISRLRVQAWAYKHKNPAVHKKARRAEKRIRVIARRLWREIQWKLTDEQRPAHVEMIRRMGIAIRQTAEPGTERIHSLHEPDVVCIAKGKAHKPYEFGSKVSIAIDPTSGLVVEATIGRLKSLHRLCRNFLPGIVGDTLNVILAAAGNNFREWLRSFCRLVQTALLLLLYGNRSGNRLGPTAYNFRFPTAYAI